MKKTTKNERSITGGQSKLLRNKKTVISKSQRVESKRKRTLTSEDSDIRYRCLFEHMLNGFAYCKMIFEDGHPRDFIYLEVNCAFESLTGIKDVVGKNMSEVIPGLNETDPELFDLYGRVASTGKPEQFETYVKALKTWFQISVYCPQREYFVAVFDVITERKQAVEALSQYAKRFEQAETHASLGSWEFDVTEGKGWWSKQMYRMLGFEELKDVPSNEEYLEHIHPDDRPLIQDALISMSQGKESTPREFRSNPDFGPMRNFAPTYFAERDSQGKLVKFIGTLQDITERKQAEEELVAERDLLNTLINTLPDSIFIKDVMGRIVIDNNVHRRTLGANILEQVVGKTDFDFFPREQAAIYDGDEKQVLRSGEPLIDKVSPFTYKDHSQRWLLTTKVPFRDREGIITGIVGFNHDITQRKMMEEELVNERNLLRTLIDNLPDVVYAKDLEGRFIIKNLLDARQMGASSPEETVGKTDFDYYSPELAAQYYADDQAVFHSGQPLVNREEPIVDATGRSGWVLTTKVPLRGPQGKVIGLVGIGHDITERKQAEERIQHQLQRLAALRAIDQVITSSFDLHNSLTEILMHIKKELGVDAADVLILNTGSQSLEFSAGVGFRTRAAEKASVRLGHSFAGGAALERQLIQVPNLKDQAQSLQLRAQLEGEDFVCYYGVPLMAKGSVKGVLEIFHRGRLEPDQEWLDFLNTLAGQAALAIDSANLFDNLQRSNIDLTLAYDATIEGWSHAMDLRDKETEGHTLRVTKMTMELAALFGIKKDEDLVGIRRGSLLHDIGKMGIPDTILFKPSTLTDEEWVMMKMHPTLAFEMLSPIRYLQSAIGIPYCHHEKWDGTGYPRGLKGEQIPLAARIFALADVWDALTSDRPYRNAWPNEKALEYLKSEAGKRFDPAVVKICLDAGVFDRKGRN